MSNGKADMQADRHPGLPAGKHADRQADRPAMLSKPRMISVISPCLSGSKTLVIAAPQSITLTVMP